MRLQIPFVILTLVLASSGCVRARFVTEAKADGSWQRINTFTGKIQKEGSMMPGTSLEDIFVLPAGTAWKQREEKKGDERILTFERTLKSGDPLKGDVTLKGGAPGKISLVNQVVVTKRGPNQIEYRETLHWSGPSDLTMNVVKPEDLDKVRAALPKPLATDENAKAIIESAARQFIPMLFGPGEPLLAIGIMHPDLAERRIYRQAGASLDKALVERFGDKLTAAERHDVVANLIKVQLSASKPSPPDPTAAADGPGSSKAAGSTSSGLTPIIFIVHAPGRVVSTNGERDDFSGEVYWAMYPEAAIFSDIVMTAIYDVTPR
jgi:hypothetical protein